MARRAAGAAARRPGRCGARATAPRPLRDRLTRAGDLRAVPLPGRLRVAIAPLRLAAADRGRPADRHGPASSAGSPPPPSRRCGSRRRVAGRCRPGGSPSGWRRAVTRRAVVGMLTGCVQSVFFPGVNAATARVLAAEGCDVIIPRSQGCCGALSLHSGRAAEAVRFAQRTIETFEAAGVDAIVVNSAGCGSAMKEYERLFADSPAAARRRRRRGLARAAGQVEARPGRPGRRCRRRCATFPSSSTRSGRSRSGIRSVVGGLPRRLPPGARAADHRRAARRCCAPSPGSSWWNCGTPGSAAVRPASITCCSRTRRRSSGHGRPTRSSTRAPRCSSRPTPAAPCRSRRSSPPRASRCGPRTPPRCSTPRSTAFRSA